RAQALHRRQEPVPERSLQAQPRRPPAPVSYVTTFTYLDHIGLSVNSHGIHLWLAGLGRRGCGRYIVSAGHGLKCRGVTPVFQELEANLRKQSVSQYVVDFV